MKGKTIGILTSGGDAPGMNSAIWSVVRAAARYGYKTMGIHDGYVGLISREIEELTLNSTDGIQDMGGTILGTARCEEMFTEEGRAKAAASARDFDMDGLVVIGGDGSFNGAKVLSDRGIATAGIPGTIDNDLGYTDCTIGFDTAVNTNCEAVTRIRDTMKSHDRIGIVEVMGRHCGDIALHTALNCGADYVLVPEIEYQEVFDLPNVIKRIQKLRAGGKKDALIIIAEGILWEARDRAYRMRTQLAQATGISVRETVLGYQQRGGRPSAYDRELAVRMGIHAVDALAKGQKSFVVGIKNGQLFEQNVDDALNCKLTFKRELYDTINRLAGSYEELEQ